ncbi:hypothetical protein C0431_09665 [bacterium]|nr:hypothetical protein [bacterium]
MLEYVGQPNAFRPLKASPPFTFEPYTKNPTFPREENLDLWPEFVSDESDAIPQKFPDHWILLGTSQLTGGSKIEVFVRSTDKANEYEIKFRIGSQPESAYLMERKNPQGVPFPKREHRYYMQSRFDKFINGIIS